VQARRTLVPRPPPGYDRRRMPRLIEPIGHQAKGFREAEAWDREQLARMSLDERLRIAELLRRRVYGADAPDVRRSERQS
jgi:hypothetical protein